MGLLDSLLGRSKPVRANLDALFALPSAAVTLQSAAGLIPSGSAGICWKPPAGQGAANVASEITQLLGLGDDGQPTSSPEGSLPLSQVEDTYGFRWILMNDPDIEDLVTRIHMVNTTLTEAGWGPQLLCSVFGMIPGPDAASDARRFFLVYLYKRGTFYPFAPDAPEHRDTELELRVRSLLGVDLPVEHDLARWFALWDLPVK
jgi:hypothetical protein